MISCVIWDWNGTLLDDVDISIEAMNRVLERYGLERLGRERYREITTNWRDLISARWILKSPLWNL